MEKNEIVDYIKKLEKIQKKVKKITEDQKTNISLLNSLEAEIKDELEYVINKKLNILKYISNEKRNLKISTNNYNELKDSFHLVNNLIKILKFRPDILSKIIHFSNIITSQNLFINLIFFCYDDYNSRDDNININLSILLFYILKTEISDTNLKKDYFSKTSKIYSFFKNLIYRSDIEHYLEYIHSILFKKIDKFEDKLLFDIEYIKSNVDLDKFKCSTKEKDEVNLFKKNYLVSLEVLSLKIHECKNANIKQYIEQQFLTINKNEMCYDNNENFSKIMTERNSENMLKYLFKNYNIIKEALIFIINTLTENIILIPNVLKYFIKILIEYYFPKNNINNSYEYNIIQRNYFISKILFGFIFKEYLKYYFNINKISETTKDNFEIIFLIFYQFIKGKFFTNKYPNYLIFNLLFIELIPNVINFYDNLLNFELPNVLQSFIKNNFNYDNKEKCISSLLDNFACLSLEDIYNIFQTLYKHSYDIFNDETIEGNDINEKVIVIIEKYLCGINTKGISERQMYLQKRIKELTTSNIKMYLIFNNSNIIVQKNKDTFIFNSILGNKEKKDIINIKIEKIKKSLCLILKNVEYLSNIFIKKKEIDLLLIIKDIKSFAKFNDIVADNNIPLEWYIDTMLKDINDLPEEYKNNCYEKLFIEIYKDLDNKCFFENNRSILIGFKNNLCVLKKRIDKKINVIKTQSLIKDLYNCLMEDFEIYQFINIGKNESEFDYLILNKNSQNNVKIKKAKKKFTFCKASKNILSFLNDFIDLSKYSINSEDGINEINRKFIKPNLNTFFEFVINKINIYHSFFGIENEDLNLLKNEVNKITFNIIYDKIFISSFNVYDEHIYMKCYKLSWLKLKNLTKIDINLDNILDECKYKYYLFENKHKSPIEKISDISNIIKLLNKNLIFETGNLENSQDQLLPLLLYVIIKSKPKHLNNNIVFIDIFFNSTKNSGKDYLILTMLKGVMTFIFDFNPDTLFDISKDEYDKYCKEKFELYAKEKAEK